MMVAVWLYVWLAVPADVRVVAVTEGDGPREVEAVRRWLVRLLRLIRIEALVLVLTLHDRKPPPPQQHEDEEEDGGQQQQRAASLYRCAVLHSLMREHCASTALLFLALPTPPQPEVG